MDILAILSFVLIVVLVTAYAYKKSKLVDNQKSEGFFLGGRSMTAIPVAGTIIMANLSTEQLVGQNGQSYVAGMEVMAWEVTAGIAIIALALVFLPKYLKYGINTIPDFFEMRFDPMTKRIMSGLIIINYGLAFLPVVFYSGALVFNNLFQVDEMLGVRSITAVILIVIVTGILSIIYLLVGGLTLSAISNAIYGLGLLILGLAIPFLGLAHLGGGSVVGGVDHIVDNTPWLLNSVGAVDSNYVPWPTLFTGMLFNNLFFWCTNQMIVQKAFAAKNLAEAQKGTLLVGLFKVIAALVLIFPGVIARNIFGDALMSNPDSAYPALVREVLPLLLNGVFAAVIFGAILSTITGGLIATSTLFSLDFYKGLFRKDATDEQVAYSGKVAVFVLGVISMIVAPLVAFAPDGLYHVVQEFNGLYNMPLLVLVLAAFYMKKATTRAAKATLITHVVAYGLLNFVILDIHYLYTLSFLFFIDLLVLIGVSKWKPEGEFEITSFTTKVDLEPWKHAKLAGSILLVLIILTYVVFSPIGFSAIS